jgi:DNA-binding transcriptional ArsR family regulator
LAKAAAMFKALSDASRLKILWALAQRPCCVSELASISQDEISTVSQRLRILRADRLVVRRREGKHAIYSVNDHHVVEMIQNAVAHAQED